MNFQSITHYIREKTKDKILISNISVDPSKKSISVFRPGKPVVSYSLQLFQTSPEGVISNLLKNEKDSQK